MKQARYEYDWAKIKFYIIGRFNYAHDVAKAVTFAPEDKHNSGFM